MDTVQTMLMNAARLAKSLTTEEELEGMAEVTGAVVAPRDLPADVRLRAEGWEPVRVVALGGRVWTRGEERCILTPAGDVRPF